MVCNESKEVLLLKKTKMRRELFELIYLLLEEKKLFINPDFNGHDVCSFFPLEKTSIDKIVIEEFGCSVDTIISLFRIQYARKLLYEGFDYENVWKYSGFKSKRIMMKAFYRVVV